MRWELYKRDTSLGFEGELYMHWLPKVTLSLLTAAGHICLCAHYSRNITNVYNCVLLQEEQILIELIQITIFP